MSDDSPKRPNLSRRAFLGALGTLSLSARLALAARRKSKAKPKAKKTAPPRRKGPRVVVVGAGAFGGWTALELLRRGAQVTLVDAWGPGNARASSGGETRVIRGVYGPDRIYTEMAARAFRLWHENERRWNKMLYRRTGALWMLGDEGAYARAAMPILKDNGFAYE